MKSTKSTKQHTKQNKIKCNSTHMFHAVGHPWKLIDRSAASMRARKHVFLMCPPGTPPARTHVQQFPQITFASFLLVRSLYAQRSSVGNLFCVRVFLVPSLRIIIILRHVVVQPYPVPVIFSRTFCGRMDMIFYFIFLTSHVLLDYFVLTLRTLL